MSSISEESEFELEMPTIISPADAAREAERRDKAREAVRQEAVREGAALDKAAAEKARRELAERIRRWNERTLENVGDDIKTTFSLTKAGELEKKAYALLGEYNALVAAHEKLLARCYSITDESGVTRYVYIYPTEELWMERPGNSRLLYNIFDSAYYAAKEAGDVDTKAKLKQIVIGFNDKGGCCSVQRYQGPDTLPPSAVPCPEPVASEEKEDTKQGCTLQGGSKKSKSKYSRKTKSKSKKSKSKKSKSKYLRKSKSKLKSKYSRKY